MTRINSAIPVQCLTDEHLLAEHREIKRLPYCLKRAIASGSIRNIPAKFCLGSGHVLFFLNKIKFVAQRYNELHQECIHRGFSITDYSSNFSNISPEYDNEYTPSDKERSLLIERITQRILKSSKTSWHYYRKAISKEDASKLLDKIRRAR